MSVNNKNSLEKFTVYKLGCAALGVEASNCSSFLACERGLCRILLIPELNSELLVRVAICLSKYGLYSLYRPSPNAHKMPTA